MEDNKELYFLFILMGIVEIVAQFLLKKGSQSKNNINIYLFTGLIFILVAYIILYFVMRTGKHISVIHAIHHTSIAIFIAFGSYILFKQNLNKKQLGGLILVIIGTFILSLNENNNH